jgi:hypothetical protein
MLRVPDEVQKNFRLIVNSIDCFLVSIIEEAEVGPEEVPCQERQNLILLEDGEEQIEVEHLLLLALFEKTIQDAGSFCLDHLDDLKWQLILAVVRVARLGSHRQVADCLRNEPGIIGNVVE